MLNPGITNRFPFIGQVALLLLLLSGCSVGSEHEGTAPVQIVLKPAPEKPGLSKVRQAPAPFGVSEVRLDVTGPDMNPLTTSTAVTPNAEVSLSLEIPAGPSRRFIVAMTDAEGATRLRGEATSDLISGTPAQITVLMEEIEVEIPILVLSPSTAVVAKGSNETFTALNGADPADVDWSLSAEAGGEPILGRITPEGVYTPPARIPTDSATPIGNPIPVTVTASDRNRPALQSSVPLLLTTGSTLVFDRNEQVTPAPGLISTQSSGQRSIAFHQGHVYAVWLDFPPRLLRGRVLFSESADGVSWTPPVPVDTGVNSQAEPALAIGPDGAVYIIFVECPSCTTPSPAIRLVVRRSGESAFKNIPLTMRGTQPQNPTVAVSRQGTVYAAWSASQGSPSQIDILLQRIDQAGDPIDASPKDLTVENGAFNESQPALALGEAEELFLAWQVSANSTEIAATASLDGGNTFLQEVRINDTEDQRSSVSHPSLAAGPERSVYVAWEKDTCSDGCTVIFYNVLRVGSSGLAFEKEKGVGFSAEDSVRQNSPSIASDAAGGISLLFHETLSGFDMDGIFLAKNLENAATRTFSRIDDPPSGTVNKSFPSLAVDSAGRAFAIWMDGRNGLQGNTDIFFAKGE
jgi:hypothetical protein